MKYRIESCLGSCYVLGKTLYPNNASLHYPGLREFPSSVLLLKPNIAVTVANMSERRSFGTNFQLSLIFKDETPAVQKPLWRKGIRNDKTGE